MTATPPVAQQDRPSAILRTILLVAVCWRFGEGTLGGVLRALGAETGPVSSFVTWIVLLSLFPVGWLCDRRWSERRVATIGGWMLAASVAVAAFGSYAPTVKGSIVLAGLGTVLLRIALPMLLGNLYVADDPRRLPGFIALEGALSLGLLASSLLLKFLGRDVGVWGFAFPAVALGSAVWLLRRLPSRSAGTGYGDEVRVQQGGGTLRVVLQAVSVAAALIAFFFVVPDTWLVAAVARVVYPGIAVLFVLVFFIWAFRHFTMPSTRAAVRTLAIVVAAGVVFWALYAITLTWTSVLIEALRLVNLTALSKVAAALVLLFIWRRVSRTLVPATATAIGLSFACIACAYILVAIVGHDDTDEYPSLVVYALTGAGNVLISAAAVSVITALAPGTTTGRTIAVWFLAPTIANTVRYLVDRQTDPAFIAPAMVAASLFLAFLFLPGARDGRDRASPGLLIGRPGRARKAALALSGLIAVAGAGWIVIGNDETANAAGLAVSTPPTFRGADGAFLPDDADLGFVVLDPGSSIIVGAIGDAPRGRDETPATTVTLKRFALGKFEVTVAQYRQCVVEYACQPADARATAGGDDLPVRYVSWSEALQYCQWLEKKLAGLQTGAIGTLLAAGARVTLPSEAEWEAASLNLKDTPWAGPLEPTRANYADSGRLGPVRVGELGASSDYPGMRDLLGNVAEWTRSEYRSYPYNPEDGREDTTSMSVARVIRGGSFYDGPSLVRISARRAADPGRGYDFVGFRVAIAQPSASRPATSGTAAPTSAAPPQPASAAPPSRK